MAVNVLVVDDQILPRLYLSQIVERSEKYQLTAAIAYAGMADQFCSHGLVDLIIMDVVMEDGISGLEAAERIKASYPKVKILLITSMPDAAILDQARLIGVDSFWYKEIQDAPMLDVMDRTMDGEHVFPDAAPQVKLGCALSSELTTRELDVLRELTAGYSNQEIAQRLNMSVNTVRFHLSSLLSKTGFTSRTELAIRAAKRGIAVSWQTTQQD